jgi:hypothetical protein
MTPEGQGDNRFDRIRREGMARQSKTGSCFFYFKGRSGVVRTITKAVLFGMVIAATVGCDVVVQKATGQIIKMKMADICGEEDKGCLAAVDKQYGACETKYKNEWSAYMNAGSSKEDALLDDYMAKLFTCVVDVDGDPYFEYSPG